MPCRINRRRIWVSRLMLESTQHQASCFVTLTYAPEFYPVDGSLNRRDPQLWLKRLRKSIEPLRIRYYLVGEYGEHTERAHYHCVLFGVSFPPGKHVDCRCVLCRSWGKGLVHVGEVNRESITYLGGYLLKRLTIAGAPALLGRYPEFAAMSRRPGIGAGAVASLGSVFTSEAGSRSVARSGDVGNVVRIDGKMWPLGRYLMRRVRMEAGSVDGAEPRQVALDRSAKFWYEVQTFGLERRRSKREVSARSAAARVRLGSSRRKI